MSNIFGAEDTIKKAKAARPGDPTVLINWDLINDLPEEFEAKISEVKFNVDEDFTNIGTDSKPKYYPKTKLMYKIADAIGLSGDSESIIEPIYEDVEIDEMNMTTTGMIIRKKVGVRVQKRSYILAEDGAKRYSSVRSGKHNAWENCLKVWHKEEKTTKGYSLCKDGEFTYYNKKQHGKFYEVVSGKYTNQYPVKYATKWDRKCYFDDEMDKAEGQADTKAHLKTIRELAGLTTGFLPQDLRDGRFIFQKIRRSRESLKMETAVRLSNIGKEPAKETKLLFGSEPKEDIVVDPEPEPVSKTLKQILIETIESYGQSITEEMQDTVDSLLSWLDKTDNPEESKYWTNGINLLKQIEQDMPEEFRVKHGLY
jgi:hypothetical protein